MIDRLLSDRRVALALRAAAVCSWVALAVISLVPGNERPHTGLSGNQEHMLAYALAAFVTRLALTRMASRYQLIAFAAAAALFEVCQIWIPGRHAGVDNWAASTAGALIGSVLARTLGHAAKRCS